MELTSDHLIRRIKKHEKLFSKNHYNGSGRTDFVIKKGRIPIMVSAPHAVNHLRAGANKAADMYTGAIALYLYEQFGCHIIYQAKYASCDPNYDSNDHGENKYQTALRNHVEQNGIKFLIDLHGAARNKPYAVEMGTAPRTNSSGEATGAADSSLKDFPFVANLIRYCFDYVFRDLNFETKEVWKNRIFSAGNQNTVTKYISRVTNCPCVQLEINRNFRDIKLPLLLKALIEGLSMLVSYLEHVDWSAKTIQAFRLGQSYSHMPQDKVELDIQQVILFKKSSLLHVMSQFGNVEMVRLYDVEENAKERLRDIISEENDDEIVDVSEYLFLTNRLIENLWNRNWIQGDEQTPKLRGIPVLLYESQQDLLKMGVVKADQVGEVSFSSNLYQSKLEESKLFDFVLFNRNNDSRLHIDFAKADYHDNGRIINPRVMIPKYYKDLLGFTERPLSLVRKEEYMLLIERINVDTSSFLSDIYGIRDKNQFILDGERLRAHPFYALLQKIGADQAVTFQTMIDDAGKAHLKDTLADYCSQLLSKCYQLQSGTIFYNLDPGLSNTEGGAQIKKQVCEIENYYHWFDYVEILKVPKTDKKKDKHFLGRLWDSIRKKMLEIIIGKTEYCMKTCWTNLTDDKNNVARISRNMMNLLGVSENDKVVIKYGQREAVVRVLEGEDYTDSQVGVPAPVRKSLGMNSTNDLVVLYRDMKYIFKRHSQEQTVAIIGTVLAVFQVINDITIGILLCILFVPIILYFALNEERIKVK